MLLSFLCVVGVLLALIGSFLFFHVRYASFQNVVGEECVIEGTVIRRVGTQSYATTIYAEIDELNGERVRADVKLECAYATALQTGDRFRATATAKAFDKGGQYNEESYALSDGILLTLECNDPKDCAVLKTKSHSLRVLFANWNVAAAFRLENAVGGREGKLASALLLGNRSGLNPDETLAFRRTGVSHLLALSGLHVSILIAFVEWLLKKCACPKRARVIVMACMAIFYLFLTGGSLSTARAVCMLCVLSLAECLQYDYDPFTGLCATLAFLILLMPYAVLDLGMWMSFIAAGSIIVFSPALTSFLNRVSQKLPLPRLLFKVLSSLVGAFFVGTVANLALFLLQAIAFDEISLLSVPATMLLSVPLTLTLVFAIVALIVPPLGFLCRFCAHFMLEATLRLSDFENIVISTNDRITQGILFVLTVVLIVLALAKLKKAIWATIPIALMLAAVIAAFGVTYLSDTSVRTIPMEESSGLTLYTYKGSAVAVNDAISMATDAYDLSVALREARCTELDDLIITTYYNQAPYFLSSLAGKIKIRNLRLPPPTTERERGIAMRLCEEAEERRICVSFDLKDLALDIVIPDLPSNLK